MAAQAQKLVDDGYDYLKIKVHGDVEDDVARVRAIRAQVGDGILLTIDANQSYTVERRNRGAKPDGGIRHRPLPNSPLRQRRSGRAEARDQDACRTSLGGS